MLTIISHQENTNQNGNDITFTAARMALISKTDINECWGEHGETGTLIHSWKECKWSSILENSLMVPQKANESYQMTQQFHS